jgi:hypothetical protein
MSQRAIKSIRRHRPATIPVSSGISEIPIVPFDVDQILHDLLAGEFRDLTVRPIWQFAEEDTLAFIRPDYPNGPLIVFHSILNNLGTPYEVIKFILKHELLHLRIRPREIDGKLVSHPPEFFEVEKQIAPELLDYWQWMMINFYPALKRNEKKEQTKVLPRIARRYRKDTFCSFEESRRICAPKDADKAGAAHDAF